MGQRSRLPAVAEAAEEIELEDKVGRIPMTWRRAERCSPVGLVLVFMDWRSLRRIPGVKVAIVE